MTGDLEERVLAYLREHPGAGPREIADAVGEPVSRVRAALARLRDRGLVARGDEGHYYAVAHLVKGTPPRELRRAKPARLTPDTEALLAALAELEARLDRLEKRLQELEKRCAESKQAPGEPPRA